jgi:hypothetical protein
MEESTMPRHALVPVAVMLAVGAAAQSPVLKDVNRLFPAWRAFSPVHAIGDVDGDGHRDVVFVATGTGSEVWLGSQGSVFRGVAASFPRIDERVNAVVLADFDGDGDLDCAVAASPNGSSWGSPGSQGYCRVHVNDGTGRFQPSVHGPFASGIPCIAAGDIDGDGDRDLVLGSPPSTSPFVLSRNQVLVNDGTGLFTLENQRLTTPTPGTNALALFDQDGDGDLDLYCGNTWGSTSSFPPSPAVGDQLFHNDGAGFFTQVPLATFAGNSTLEVHARDFDGDGDVDVLTREAVPQFAQGLQYRRNDGGTFTSFVPAIPPVPGSISQLLTADWNGDGLLDFAVRYGSTLHLRVQTAPGQFAASGLPSLWTMDRNVLAFDHDGDGDGDVIAPAYYFGYPTWAGAPESEWFRNLGTTWALAPRAPVPALPFASASRGKLVDVDRDGDLDVVQSPHYGPGGIWTNDGGGSFTAVAIAALGDFATPIPFGTGDLAFGDVDGDQDVDIVAAIRPGSTIAAPFCQLYRNAGGVFVASQLAALHADQVALGDLDGDGDLDMVLTGYNTRAVLRNDGTGTFTPTTLPAAAVEFSIPLVIADVDGDLDLDIACYSAWPQSQAAGFLANDGSGSFTPVPIPGMSQWLRMAAADFDADGDVDFVLDNSNNLPRQLLRNGGGGAFTIQTLPSGSNSSTRVLRSGDVDGDGWPDLLEIEACGPACGLPASRVLRNDHTGGFTPVASSIVEPPYDARDAELGDVDGDGDVDLMLASWHATELYRNLNHQVAWTSWPRVGHTLMLELYGRAGEACALGVAFAPAATPLPLPGIGTLRLDLASLLIVATGTYDANGTGVFVSAIPNVPAFVGLTLYWQALSVGPALHLGNLEVTTLAAR